MKKLIFLLVLLFPVVVLAEDVTVTWVPPNTVAHIDGYRVYQSDDMGQSWHQVAEVSANVTSTVVQAEEDHLILWRASAYNAQTEAVRLNAGAWYNGLWTTPDKPKGAGSKLEN